MSDPQIRSLILSDLRMMVPTSLRSRVSEMVFIPARLELAMDRSRVTARVLADQASMTDVSLSLIKTDKQAPTEATVERIASALEYPVAFFYGSDVDTLLAEAINFRILSSVTNRERNAAIAACSIAYIVSDWLQSRYTLPKPSLTDAGPEREPAKAARTLRQAWGLGERPIGNSIKLLEAKDIRVSLWLRTLRT